jgi:alpha-galactosidase
MAEQSINWNSGGISLVININSDGNVLLQSLQLSGSTSTHASNSGSALPLVEIRLAGDGSLVSSSHRQMGSPLGRRLRYVRHETSAKNGTEHLDVEMTDPVTSLTVISHFTAYSEIPVLRSTVEVRNISAEDHILQAVSSLALGGLTGSSERFWNDYKVSYANNSWFREAQWVEQSLPEVGLDNYGIQDCGHSSTRACFSISNQGTFSTGTYLPMGTLCRVDGKQSWLWQIEHNGSWRWEIADLENQLYLLAGGPTDQDHQWSKLLKPGESFASVPVAIAIVEGDRSAAFSPMTEYRRRIRRPHPDNERLPIIFNDYMNCLMGDPTTEKVEALIGPAAQAGAEYFCIDCGWYSDDDGWWDSVGEWEESKVRFPMGLKGVMDNIKRAGMVPGLWIEPEVIGVKSPIADSLPKEAFFQRYSKRVSTMNRYQLDYRHPAVIERMDKVIDRLVNKYGAGYFKFDYNIDITQGTDVDALSPGDGVFEHQRAYLAWVEGIFKRFPDLVIESCSSGAQRMDYAMLAMHPLQSTSDQQDPVKYAAIAAAVPTAVTPEQSATWAYPQPDWSNELIALTVVNSLLGRVHLSGRLDLLSVKQLQLVADGMAIYKRVRQDLCLSSPFWPLGFPAWHDDWLALGMKFGDTRYVAVWRRGGASSCKLPIAELKGMPVTVECLYPLNFPNKLDWEADQGRLSVELPEIPSARLLRLNG